MGITCSICKKNQSGWITDYPLSNLLSEYRICGNCYDRISKINNSKPGEDLSDEIDYLKSFTYDDNVVEQFIEHFVSMLEDRYDDAGNIVDNSQLDHEVVENIKQAQSEKLRSIMLTSGYNFENHNITKYHDFVSSESAIGLGLFKTIFAGLSNTFGTESASLKGKLIDVKEAAFTDLKLQAINLGANAIIGIDLDYTMFGDTIVAVVITGTAVTAEPAG